MRTLYTNNFAGAAEAVRDFIGYSGPQVCVNRKTVQALLRHYAVARVRDLKSWQIPDFITALGLGMFHD